MDPLQVVISILLKFLRFLQFLIVKFYFAKIKHSLLRKFKKIGLDVVISSEKNDILEKERIHFETSKSLGEKPTLTIYNEKFFERIALERGLGFGEAYLEGWWDCDRMDVLSTIFAESNIVTYHRYYLEKLIDYLEYEVFNLQTVRKAYEVAEGHYDLGNELFQSFLDPSMTYSCAYWGQNATNLAEAQQHKMDLIARKLKLEPGMRVLDLGCGWGGLAHFLAEKYQVSVVGCNIAKDGVKIAKERCKGLPVEIRHCDYREIDEKFDRVVTVGFMEHVGPKNYKTYMEVAHRCLKNHGIFLTHTIGCDDSSTLLHDPFVHKYIFPNGVLPRAKEVTEAIDGLFTIEDWHNFGHDYSKTLWEWYKNFIEAWPSIKHKFKDSTKFYRMWTFYLLAAFGMFKSRKYQLWQIILTKNGLPGGYQSIR